MKYEIIKLTKSMKILFLITVLCAGIFAQSTEPKPGAPKSVKIPAIKDFTLENGLEVVVVERPGVPLVSAQLLIRAGASDEAKNKAGLAAITTELLSKGTKTRSAGQIASEMEFLGSALNVDPGWIATNISVNVMSDKLEKSLELMSDSVINPTFPQEEIDLLKTQMIDGLSYNLTQPGFLASYAASSYSFGKHPSGGTVASINIIDRDSIAFYHQIYIVPERSVLILVGDVNFEHAKVLAEKNFGKWKKSKYGVITKAGAKDLSNEDGPGENSGSLVSRILVIDLPNSGQAAVSFTDKLQNQGRLYFGMGGIRSVGSGYFPAILLNSLLGGGYSSRLNQEIRIKRGLSYGAGSSFSWDWSSSDFSTRTQTKNESAAEVAELVVQEIQKLKDGEIPESELNPRRLVLTGGFGRNLETNQGLASAISDVFAFRLSAENLNTYMNSVTAVTEKQIKQFAAENFNGGDIIIVGDYSIFKDDLSKRFPKFPVSVVKADELDITKEDLRKK